MKRLGTRCSSIPADCSKNTNGPALPSMMGTSGALTSTSALSIPSPAKAESKCSTVETRAPPTTNEVPSMVSPTLSARAGISTGVARSVRRKTIPVSGAAGRTVMSTRLPVCRPTPLARIVFFRVRCPTIKPPEPVSDIPIGCDQPQSRVSVPVSGPAMRSASSRRGLIISQPVGAERREYRGCPPQVPDQGGNHHPLRS